MDEKWYGEKCEYQICKFERDSEGAADMSKPVLVYCKHNENKKRL